MFEWENEENLFISPQISNSEELKDIFQKLINKFSDRFNERFEDRDDILNVTNDRLKNVSFKILDAESYKERYERTKGKGAAIPSGYYSPGEQCIYLSAGQFINALDDRNRYQYTFYHELLHALSDNGRNKLGLKMYQETADEKGDDMPFIGQGMNEAKTSDLVDEIMGTKGRGGSYSKDYSHALKLLEIAGNISSREMTDIFFLNEEFYDKEIEEKFCPQKLEENYFKKLLYCYDIRTTKEFDPNFVVKTFIKVFEAKDGTEEEKKDFYENLVGYCDYWEHKIDKDVAEKVSNDSQSYCKQTDYESHQH